MLPRLAFTMVAGLVLGAFRAEAQATHILVITGLGGDPAHSETFTDWADRFIDAVVERHGVPAESVVYLAEKPDGDARTHARSTSDNVRQAVAEISAHADPGDHVFMLLIGHGSYAGGESRFNLPGPDLSAKDFALMLDQLSEQKVAFINVSSASGGFVEALSGEDRTIITATKTGMERNDAVFGKYFVDAFAQEGADLDKDERVSLLEAFRFARQEVARAYEQDNRLLTEHAMLDDNGDGKGSADPATGQADGSLAQTMFLVPAAQAAGQSTDDPVLQRLYEERTVLQSRIDELRALRDQMDPERYEAQLEVLLVELALKNREIRAREGGG
ncbi:MAG: C13 family peptidase [Longimicrobiales bacterium]